MEIRNTHKKVSEWDFSNYKSMKLIYVMDPLCGWCYGNSANILRLENELRSRIEFEVLPWGMWIGNRARYQSVELAQMIRSADARLRSIAGVEMTEAYDALLDDTNVFLDSEPGCRAINTVNQIAPELTLTFSSLLSQARYIYWKDNTRFDTFIALVEKLELDREKFSEIYESDAMKQKTTDIFTQAWRYAQSYPSLFLVNNDTSPIPISLRNYQYDAQKIEILQYL